MIEFKIPHRLPSLNEYTRACRGNKYAGAQLKAATEDTILWVLKSVKGKITKPCWIVFVWHEPNRRRDKDNVCFAKKFVLDALQKSGILPNDNNRYILGFTDCFVYGAREGVSVIIEEAT